MWLFIVSILGDGPGRNPRFETVAVKRCRQEAAGSVDRSAGLRCGPGPRCRRLIQCRLVKDIAEQVGEQANLLYRRRGRVDNREEPRFFAVRVADMLQREEVEEIVEPATAAPADGIAA